jgi:hypothetical protein
MPITDAQVAPLRAQLAANIEEHRRLLAQLPPGEVRREYRMLVTAAFCVAGERRFPSGSSVADVIEFVADARSRTQRLSAIDPRIAERVVLAVAADEDINDIDPKTSFETQLLLLAVMTADARYDAVGLEEFLTEARKLADQWLSSR